MRCYNHHDREAIGTCKACSRGLCDECANDLGHGLACRDKHEEMVEAYNMIMSRSSRIYRAAPKNIWILPVFQILVGIIFCWFGYTSREGMMSLTFLLGVGFIVFGVIILMRNRQLFGSMKT